MTIPEWAERRIGSILAAPRVWGSLEAVEAQVIILCEVRQMALTGSPGGVLEAYRAHVAKYFPDDLDPFRQWDSERLLAYLRDPESPLSTHRARAKAAQVLANAQDAASFGASARRTGSIGLVHWDTKPQNENAALLREWRSFLIGLF